MKKLSILCITTLVLFACNQETKQVPHITSENTIEDNTATINRFVYNGLKIFESNNPIQDIYSYYGKPTQITQSKEQFTKEMPKHTFHYPGLEISIIQGEDKAKSFINSIILSTNQYPVTFDLNVGTNKNNLIKILSTPNIINNDGSFVYTNDLNNYTATIFFKDNKISKIIWLPYVD